MSQENAHPATENAETDISPNKPAFETSAIPAEELERLSGDIVWR